MNARERDWIMVRVRRDVHAELVRVGKRLWDQKVKGFETHYRVGEEGLPLSNIIQELIRRDQAHQERSRKSRAKRRRKYEKLGEEAAEHKST